MITKIAEFFSNLTPECVDRLGDFYAEDCRFRDPINEGRGLDDLKVIFEDLFKQLKNLKMTMVTIQGDGKAGCLEWVMHYRFRGKARELPGSSWFEFSPDGKVVSQRDYWDAGAGVYREFPGVGFVIGRIKKLVRVRPK